MTVSPAVLHRLGGEGPPLLLVHGFAADRFGWAANAHALFGGFTVLAAELPGHGAAGAQVGDGLPETLAERLRAALSDLPPGLPVVAHSLGAVVAAHLAAMEPGRIGRLVALAPAFGPGIDRTFLSRLPELTAPDEAEALLARMFARPQRIAPMAAHVLTALAAPGRRQALATIAAALPEEMPPVPACPVTVLWGAEDRIVPPPAGAVLGVAPAVLPRAGHMPHVEAAGEVNRRIAAALA